MGAFDGDQYSKQSETNIQFGWAFQTLQLVQSVNQYNMFCGHGEYAHLRGLHTRLMILRDHLYGKFPEDLKEIDELLDKTRKDIDRFERFSLSKMMKSKRGNLIHQDLRGVYNQLMMKMKYFGVLERLRMDPKTLARNQWYGDAQ